MSNIAAERIHLMNHVMTIDEGLAMVEALADRTRLKILKALLPRALCGEELSQRLGLSASTISFHVRKLEQGGLVKKAREQYYSMLSVEPSALDLTIRCLIEARDPGEAREQQALDRFHAQVFRTYFQGGKLKNLPTQLKKRAIVLERISRGFQPGVTYTEPEVNELIRPIFEDHCLIRRMLVDEGFLDRKDGRYWRAHTAGTQGTTGTSGTSGTLPSDARPESPSPHLAAAPARPAPQKRKTTMDARTECKRTYKETPVACGAFALRNRRTGKVFLVAGFNLPGLINRHQFDLSLGSHRNRDLQADWKRDGAEGFAVETLEVLAPHEDGTPITPDDVRDLERKWLATLQPYGDAGYNELPRKPSKPLRE